VVVVIAVAVVVPSVAFAKAKKAKKGFVEEENVKEHQKREENVIMNQVEKED
jgi:hypothetical protein